MKLDKSEFFEKYSITEAKFAAAGLTWQELSGIYQDYTLRRTEYEALASSAFMALQQMTAVQSVRVRIKDPEHLIEKIVRKNSDPTRAKRNKINLANYRTELEDIIGIRLLHLFKEDWQEIHRQLAHRYHFSKPVAYVREGDKVAFPGCSTKRHDAGYRSVHYVLRLSHGKAKYRVELQVRTLFEEAWSEIDHHLRYPSNTDDPVLTESLAVLSSLAGGADEMATVTYKQRARNTALAIQAAKAEDAVAVDSNSIHQHTTQATRTGKSVTEQLTPFLSSNYFMNEVEKQRDVFKRLNELLAPQLSILREAERSSQTIAKIVGNMKLPDFTNRK